MLKLKRQCSGQLMQSRLIGKDPDARTSSVGKESACNAEDPGSIPGLGRSPGEGNGNSLQYSCLENPMERGLGLATVHGVAIVGHDLVTKPPPDAGKD